ncbi:MAG: glycoside hydrolase family 26 protein [Paludibacteraceae bacterium]|nr:glycoside hydrolase family 26 protein [Paludibacteraceae bacterium]
MELKHRYILLSLFVCVGCSHRPSIAFGHQDDVCYGHEWSRLSGDTAYRSCIHDITGQYPDLIGFDLGGIELGQARNLDSVPFELMRQEMIRQDNRGGRVTLSWHARHPMTGGTAWDTTACMNLALDSTAYVYDTLVVYITRVAQFVAAVQTQSPIIFRPWHENSGNWFWWGRNVCSAEQYHQLWHLTRHIFDQYNVQVEWVFSPDKLTLYEDTPDGALREMKEFYPGDEYVDIIGTDCYHFGAEEGIDDYLHRAHRQLLAASQLASIRHKRLAFTETGNEAIRCPHWYTNVLLPLCHQYPIEYVHVWRNAWDIETHYYIPYSHHPEQADFIQFYHQL